MPEATGGDFFAAFIGTESSDPNSGPKVGELDSTQSSESDSESMPELALMSESVDGLVDWSYDALESSTDDDEVVVGGRGRGNRRLRAAGLGLDLVEQVAARALRVRVHAVDHREEGLLPLRLPSRRP